jgi:hypothetical protein
VEGKQPAGCSVRAGSDAASSAPCGGSGIRSGQELFAMNSMMTGIFQPHEKRGEWRKAKGWGVRLSLFAYVPMEMEDQGHRGKRGRPPAAPSAIRQPASAMLAGAPRRAPRTRVTAGRLAGSLDAADANGRASPLVGAANRQPEGDNL